MYTCIYIYIYIERESERERERYTESESEEKIKEAGVSNLSVQWKRLSTYNLFGIKNTSKLNVQSQNKIFAYE